MIEPRVRAFLESVPLGVIATIRPDGRARQSTVYFVLDGDTIWMSTEAGRAKAVDIGHTEWASLCVVGPSPPYPSITVEGRASVQAGDVAPMTARVLARSTGHKPPELNEADLVAAGRVLLRLVIERVYGESYLRPGGASPPRTNSS